MKISWPYYRIQINNIKDLRGFPTVEAQISGIIIAGLKADLKKPQTNLIAILLLPYSPWNLDLSLRPLPTQTLEGKILLYKEVLGFVTTT